MIEVGGFPKGMDVLDPLEASSIDRLILGGNMNFRDLVPLVGMRLRFLAMSEDGSVGDQALSLEPLRGMPLTEIHMDARKVSDLSPLQGMPLEIFNAHGCGIVNLLPLRGAPLRWLSLLNNGVSNLGALADSPIEYLDVEANPITDLSPLRGKQTLHTLKISGSRITDLSPLRGTPIEECRGAIKSGKMRRRQGKALEPWGWRVRRPC